eukprot:373164_1
MISRFEHLVERGFLNPQFLGKIRSDPEEILRFIRQNRAVVGDQLNRRLNPSIRPTPEQLELKGIVPRGYFTKGHEIAMTRKHRRKSSAQQDLEAFIQLRPPKEMISKKVGLDIGMDIDGDGMSMGMGMGGMPGQMMGQPMMGQPMMGQPMMGQPMMGQPMM